MFTMLLAPFVAILGALLYALASGKASQLGFGAYCAGLLVTLLKVSTTIHFP